MKKVIVLCVMTFGLYAEKNSAWYSTINEDVWTAKNEKVLNNDRKIICNKILNSFMHHFTFGPLAHKPLVKKLIKKTKKNCGLTRYKKADGFGTYGYVAHNEKALRKTKCIECMKNLLVYVKCAEIYYARLDNNYEDIDGCADSEETSTCS